MTVPPVVAIVAGRYPDDRYSSHRGYIDAVLAVGGVPLIVPAGPGAPPERYAGLLEGVRALVLTGGGDVEPAVYGGGGHPAVMEVDPDRDTVDLYLARAAIARGIPVLGICRGMQLLTVALGGTLVADLPSAGHTGHWQEDLQYEPVHAVSADAGTLAAAALAGAEVVNSIHHQAVADPGPQVRATAWSPDGVIEAVEADGVLGVQWHPERLLGHDDRHLAPFRWVVAA